MTAERHIMLLVKKDGKVSDTIEADPTDFAGSVPAIGDRVVEFIKGNNQCYRVVDRVFEMNQTSNYVNLIVEEATMEDLAEFPRFMDTP